MPTTLAAPPAPPRLDWTLQFLGLASCRPATVLLDCELVCFDATGHPDFARLRTRLTRGHTLAPRTARNTPATLIVFDVLHAVFLVWDARRAGAADLEDYFTRRALGAAVAAGVAAGVVGAAGVVAMHADARFLYDGLVHEGLPLVLLSAACGLAVVVLLRGARRAARGALAVGAVAAMIWAWGVAQYPYLLPKSLTIADAAAPSATLTMLLAVFGVAVVLVLPSIVLLFTLMRRSIVEETEAPSALPGDSTLSSSGT